MQKKDKEKEFIKVNIAVLTVSDSRTAETDKSGDYLLNSIQKAGHVCIERSLIKDDVKSILDILNKWINDTNIDAVIITGGTGITGRDVTPEATELVCERILPGFGEQMRSISLQFVPTAILSRQVGGTRGKSLIFNLPGRPKAIRETIDEIWCNNCQTWHAPNQESGTKKIN